MSEMERLLGIMARLRDPDDGCPWDLEQDFASIAPYTIEEAYEVDHAIREGDMDGLGEELGDLLLQVVYHARMAEEAGLFDFAQVARGIGDKLVSRHPHVFGDEEVATSPDDQRRRWEAYKEAERLRKHAARSTADSPSDDPPDPFEGVPHALPALARAAKLQRRASRVSWGAPSDAAVLESVRSMIERISQAVTGEGEADPGEAGASPVPAIAREDVGQLLFGVVQLASKLGHDAERALRDANAAFELRVRSGPDPR